MGEYVIMHTMKQRTIGFPKGSFFLFGPRGTGKTVWLGQQFPEALTVNLLEADVRRALTAHPEKLADIVAANADKSTYIIDEIQRVPFCSIQSTISSKRTGIRDSSSRVPAQENSNGPRMPISLEGAP